MLSVNITGPAVGSSSLDVEGCSPPCILQITIMYITGNRCSSSQMETPLQSCIPAPCSLFIDWRMVISEAACFMAPFTSLSQLICGINEAASYKNYYYYSYMFLISEQQKQEGAAPDFYNSLRRTSAAYSTARHSRVAVCDAGRDEWTGA